ncbi:hypothetical protein [Streptosporangium sandarakinum]
MASGEAVLALTIALGLAATVVHRAVPPPRRAAPSAVPPDVSCFM